MNKYEHFLFLMLFLFGFQAFAGTFQSCLEAARGGSPVKSQTDVSGMTTGCHKTENDTTGNTDTCDARHFCIGTTFSIAYPSGHSIAKWSES